VANDAPPGRVRGIRVIPSRAVGPGIWCFAAGAPVGALAALVWPDPSPQRVALLAAAAGAALALLVSLLARRSGAAPARLAGAAGAGLVAVPALGVALLRLAPGAPVLLGLCLAWLALQLLLAVRGRGAATPGAALASALLQLLGGAAGLLLLAGLWAALGAEQSAGDERRAAAVYDLDARVETRELPACPQVVASWKVLLERGAHPRLSPDGALVWFDARTDDGTRQVHRLLQASGAVACWTCGQPGDNVRPSPGPIGATLVFDSDRLADWSDPSNTELYRMRTRGGEPTRSARRLTFSPGPDDHAVLGPAPGVVTWSARRGGRYFVASASLLSGHGGVLLGTPGALYAGGAAWAAPLGWSRDARSLVVVRGNPFRALGAATLDLATGRSQELGRDLPGSSPVGFSGDGGWVAVARSRGASGARRLPDALGFLLGPLAVRAELDHALFRDTSLASGPAGGPLQPISAPEIEGWGGPTGVALSPDADWLVLGQRRSDGAERLVEAQLQCSGADPRGDPP
jgi:hypothetical protein